VLGLVPSLVTASPLLCGIMKYRRARVVGAWSIAFNLFSSKRTSQSSNCCLRLKANAAFCYH
jgi:hypothetical protein